MLGTAAIIGSALCYAANIVMMRRQAVAAKPLEINFFQSSVVMILWLAALPFVGLPAWPSAQWPWVVVAALMSSSGTLLFAFAYARGEASYLAVTEYSAFLWAAALGWIVFREPVSTYTLAGAVLIVGGCLVGSRGKSSAPPEIDVAAYGLTAAEHVDGESDHADVERERGEAMDGDDLAHVRLGDRHVGRRECHPAGEREIDEIPIDRMRQCRGNSRPTQPASGLVVDDVRIMEGVDRVGEQPGQRQA